MNPAHSPADTAPLAVRTLYGWRIYQPTDSKLWSPSRHRMNSSMLGVWRFEVAV